MLTDTFVILWYFLYFFLTFSSSKNFIRLLSLFKENICQLFPLLFRTDSLLCDAPQENVLYIFSVIGYYPMKPDKFIGKEETSLQESNTCPQGCHALTELQEIVRQHGERIDKHEERLGRGNVEFAVISTKLNIIMAVLSAVGIAVCGAIISIVM